MRSFLLDASQVGVIQTIEGKAEAVRARGLKLIKGIAISFTDSDERLIGGMTFEVTTNDSRVIANISTVFGKARARLNYYSGLGELEGEIIFEREAFDDRDRSQWQPVFAVQLPSNKLWEVAEHPTNPAVRNHKNQQQELYVLGASILHSIINGPVQ